MEGHRGGEKNVTSLTIIRLLKRELKKGLDSSSVDADAGSGLGRDDCESDVASSYSRFYETVSAEIYG
jgi:hypothetical protein